MVVLGRWQVAGVFVASRKFGIYNRLNRFWGVERPMNHTRWVADKFTIDRCEIETEDGRRVTRDIVVHPGSVVILPMLSASEAVLIRNHRYAPNKRLWELPAGTLEPPEPPVACAYRELIEEAGYRAERMTPLMKLYPSPGICTELMHAFVATDLTEVGQQLVEDERIEPVVMGLDDVIEMIRKNEIEDAKTIAIVLAYRLRLEGRA
jgi:ADP-ribose pyrophosphatase